MARIRSVKPELCTSETMAQVSAEAERTFVRLWTHCDDEGRAKDHPKLLKASLFPLHDNVTASDIDAHLGELERHGLVARYTVDGARFLTCTSWKEHQHPQKPQKSKLPGPDLADPPSEQPEQDPSDTSTRPLPEGYGPVVEGSGGELVEVDGAGDVATSITTTTEAVEAPAPASDDDIEQQLRQTAIAIGRRTATDRGATNPAGYAATVTTDILQGPNPDDRDRIRTALRNGTTPDQILNTWTPSAPPGAPAARGPSPADIEAATERARRLEQDTRTRLAEQAATQPGDHRTGLEAARAPLQPTP